MSALSLLQEASVVRGRLAVTSAVPQAASAGLAAFAKGGNAFDAVLAACFVETIALPMKCGLAGDVVALFIVASGIAHCPEERHVWPEMTVRENLMLGAYLCKSKQEVEERVGMAFHRFPRLREREKQLTGTLSGGEQQMLAIGRALMSEPRLLLLDEPSLGLSPKMADEVFDVIREINGHGVTVMVVEQNIHNALSVASRAYVFETGRITAHDDSKSLLGNPELLNAYLGA